MTSLVNSIKYLRKEKILNKLLKSWKWGNTFQLILWPQHYHDAQTRQKYYKKENYRPLSLICKNSKQNFRKFNPHLHSMGSSAPPPQEVRAEAVSVVVATGLAVPRQVGSSQTRDQTGVLCIAKWILNHWTISHVQSLQSWLTLCDPMDCSLPGSSVHVVL